MRNYPKERGPVLYGEERKSRDAKRKLNWGRSNRTKVRAQNEKPYARFKRAEYGAKLRNLEFSITLERFSKLILCTCFYCGYPLDKTGAGIDRMDNSKGYTLENSSPCCGACNTAKGARWTADEMKKIIGPAIRRVKYLRIITGKDARK